MSHFSVLVITDKKPSPDGLHQIMLPWHEYECTGYEEYVVDVDVTDKMVADHEEHGDGEPFGPEWVKGWSGAEHRGGRYFRRTNAEKWSWLDAKGQEVGRTIGDATLPNLRQGSTGGRFLFGEGNEIEPARKILILQGVYKGKELCPNTCQSHSVSPSAEIWFEPTSLRGIDAQAEGTVSNLQDKVDGRPANAHRSLSCHEGGAGDFVRELQQAPGVREGQPGYSSSGAFVHNPISKACVGGSKWDWWTVGGRWTGMLVPHYDPEKDRANQQTCILCQGTGKRIDHDDPELQQKCNGCGGTGTETKWPTLWKKISGDQMRLGDVPLVTLRDEAEREALSRYDEAIKIIAGRPIYNWEELRLAHGIERAREIYWADPVLTDLRKAGILGVFDDEVGEFVKPRADVAQSARAQAVCPFAVVHAGKWYERGKMGWWGCVSNEKNRDVWAEEFAVLLDKLSPDVWLTVVDCHS